MEFRQKSLRWSDRDPCKGGRVSLSMLEPLEPRRLCSNTPILVTNSNDSSLVPPPGSLRQAIITANNMPGPDTIIFNLFGTNTGAHAITLVATLPEITEAVFIDGLSEGGEGYNGQPLIRLDGPFTGGSDPKVGLFFKDVFDSTVGGLAITGFDYGVEYDNSNKTGITNNTFAGNYVGLSTNGSTSIPNRSGGVLIHNSDGNVITHNLISGNGGAGLAIDHGSGNIVTGNFIGTNVSGTNSVGNQGAGIYLSNGSTNNQIGSNGDGVDDTAERNLISGNTGAGVVVTGPTSIGNSIRGNSIHANTGIGIDLGNDGVTPNANNAPLGPNLSQNYPVISTVSGGLLATLISGSLNSLPNTTFTLDFYASAVPNASLYGDGQRWLGHSSANTNAAGNATFTISLPASIDVGDWITATATDSNGNTSEFSQARQANIAVITLTSGNSAVIKKDADGIHADITANGAMTQWRIADVSTFAIIGGNGDDILTVDFSNGNPIPLAGLRFDGGAGSNTLAFIGTSDNDNLTASPAGLAFSNAIFGNIPIICANIQSLQFHGGSGGNDSINLAAVAYILDADTPTGIPNMTVTVGPTAIAMFNTEQHLARLVLNGGAANLSATRHSMYLNGLSIVNNGRLDIANCFLCLNNTATSFATAKTYLDAAYNLQGSTNPNAPYAGDYNGLSGITSSIAKTSYANDMVVGLGYYDGALQDPNNPDSAGQIIGPNSNSGHGTGIPLDQILIRPTLTGDFNGDGVVNSYDISLFNSYGLFNNGPTSLGWQAGDLNGDGVVNVKDITVFNTVGNFNSGQFALATPDAKIASIPLQNAIPKKGAARHRRSPQAHSACAQVSRAFTALTRIQRTMMN